MATGMIHIIEQENILNLEECNNIIDTFGNSVLKSKVGSREHNFHHNSRTSSGTKVPFVLLPEWIYVKLLIKVSLLTNYPVDNQEPWELLQYKPGEEYKPHFDRLQKPDCGQRIYSALIYLREPEEGGETFFPIPNQKIKPKLGKLVIWNNCNLDGTNIKASMHGSLPVVYGEKWSFITWVHDRTFISGQG